MAWTAPKSNSSASQHYQCSQSVESGTGQNTIILRQRLLLKSSRVALVKVINAVHKASNNIRMRNAVNDEGRGENVDVTECYGVKEA